jgi:hypothetical protein
VAGHDADLRLSRREQPRTVGAHQPHPFLIEIGTDADHIQRGDAFGDADDERNSGIGRFEDSVGGETSRHVDDRRVGLGLRHRLGDGVKHRHPAVAGPLPTLAGRDTGHDMRAVRDHLLAVELTLASGDTLHEQPGVLVDQDCHWGPPIYPCGADSPLAAATAFRAASASVVAVINR